MPVLIGSTRVSTEDQPLDLQRDALARAGCGRTFEDRRSGAKANRLGFAARAVCEICRLMGISEPKLYAHVAEARS